MLTAGRAKLNISNTSCLNRRLDRLLIIFVQSFKQQDCIFMASLTFEPEWDNVLLLGKKKKKTVEKC